MAAAFLAGAVDDTVVIAPHSRQRGLQDKLEANEVSWSCNGDSWRSGGSATSHPDLSSFDFVDEILRKLAKKATFPNLTRDRRRRALRRRSVRDALRDGQSRSRHARRRRSPTSSRIRRATPGPTPPAPLAADDADAAAAKEGWNTENVHTKFTFGAVRRGASAPNYNRWPLGLENRTGGYTAKMSRRAVEEAARRRGRRRTCSGRWTRCRSAASIRRARRWRRARRGARAARRS